MTLVISITDMYSCRFKIKPLEAHVIVIQCVKSKKLKQEIMFYS